MKEKLLKELADLDLIIGKLDSRRTDVVNMLDVLRILPAVLLDGASAASRGSDDGEVVPISIAKKEA
jgi:hypothetical protein